nr:MAG TPA: hypothetical protein [Caudoviricetes sp.]
MSIRLHQKNAFCMIAQFEINTFVYFLQLNFA